MNELCLRALPQETLENVLSNICPRDLLNLRSSNRRLKEAVDICLYRFLRDTQKDPYLGMFTSTFAIYAPGPLVNRAVVCLFQRTLRYTNHPPLDYSLTAFNNPARLTEAKNQISFFTKTLLALHQHLEDEPPIQLSVGNFYSYAESLRGYFLSKREELKQVQFLDLSGCELVSLPSEIGLLTGLFDLSLAGNFLCDLPEELQNCTILNSLDISRNSFEAVPACVSTLSELEELNLSNNKITQLPEELGNLAQMRHLNVSFNRLSNIPASFSQMAGAVSFNFSRNRIEEFPLACFSMRHLVSLNASHNRITLIPEGFSSFYHIRNIDLSANRIEVLPLDLSERRSIQLLKLSDNLIHELPVIYSNLVGLHTLDISNNQLSTLPRELTRLKQWLRTLLIEGNPFQLLPIELGCFLRPRKSVTLAQRLLELSSHLS